MELHRFAERPLLGRLIQHSIVRLLFPLSGKSGADAMCRTSTMNFIRQDIFGDDGTRGDNRTASDGHPGHDDPPC